MSLEVVIVSELLSEIGNLDIRLTSYYKVILDTVSRDKVIYGHCDY